MSSKTITLTEEEILVFIRIIEYSGWVKKPKDHKWEDMSLEDKEIFLIIQTHLINILNKISK